MGIEPTTLRTLIGCSNHSARLLLSVKRAHEKTAQISMLKSVVYERSFSSGRPALNEKTVACITLQHTYFNAFVKELVNQFIKRFKQFFREHPAKTKKMQKRASQLN